MIVDEVGERELVKENANYKLCTCNVCRYLMQIMPVRWVGRGKKKKKGGNGHMKEKTAGY
jgi:hypothetical protein